MMFLIDRQLALIMVLLLPLAALLIWGVMRLSRPLFTIVQQKLSTLNITVQENLAGVRVVKAFVRERFEIGRFGKQNESYMEENIKVGRLMALALPLLTLLTNLGIVAVIWFGGLSVIGDRLSVGELVAFNNYLMIGMAPLMLLGNILTMVSRAEASAERVWDVMDTKPAVKAPGLPHETKTLQGRVAFSGVSFSYDSISYADDSSGNGDFQSGTAKNGQNRREVLHEVSFAVEPGQRVALLGATGSGKSTLVNLIPRFYDVTGGQIQIDGVDVRDWETQALRSFIGMVLQQTTLFSGMIRQNIAFGRPEATMEEIVNAAKAAQAHDFISALPDGYDSWVEERGANLSGGQKQRIAIARALLIDPSILILDDSTSAVDLDTEAKIQEALDSLMAGRTSFVIAQRINSVLNADKIIVLEHGRISAQGTHKQLLKSSPIYQEIFTSQLGDGPIQAALAG
jgi:ATP-binding cassette subfamily B protein